MQCTLDLIVDVRHIWGTGPVHMLITPCYAGKIYLSDVVELTNSFRKVFTKLQRLLAYSSVLPRKQAMEMSVT